MDLLRLYDCFFKNVLPDFSQSLRSSFSSLVVADCTISSAIFSWAPKGGTVKTIGKGAGDVLPLSSEY